MQNAAEDHTGPELLGEFNALLESRSPDNAVYGRRRWPGDLGGA